MFCRCGISEMAALGFVFENNLKFLFVGGVKSSFRTWFFKAIIVCLSFLL